MGKVTLTSLLLVSTQKYIKVCEGKLYYLVTILLFGTSPIFGTRNSEEFIGA